MAGRVGEPHGGGGGVNLMVAGGVYFMVAGGVDLMVAESGCGGELCGEGRGVIQHGV